MRCAIASAFAIMAYCGPAHAWSQATTESGLPLHWEEECVWWTLSGAGCNDIEDFEDVARAVRSGFEAWNVDCTALAVLDGGVSDCEAVGYRSGKPHANLVIWLEENWPYEVPVGEPYAVTSVYYNPESGAILDADVEFNGEDFPWGTEGLPGDADIWNTMAHEAGHVLGLDHSGVAEATMYVFGERGDTNKRDLHTDDIEGICTIYPLDSVLEPCPDPPKGRALCQGESGGCSCAITGARGGSGARCAWVFALAAALLAIAGRRERGWSRWPRRERDQPQ